MNGRSLAAMSASLGGFGALAAIAAARLEFPGPIWRPANLVTLSRVAAASWLYGYAASARPEVGRRATWLTLLCAETAADWLDGPLARRTGATRLGEFLDQEADSWLTLSAATAAWRSGGLTAWCLIPPILRYVVRWQRGPAPPMATAGWQRAAGAMQMVALSGALAPDVTLRALARRLSRWAIALQLVALAADAPRSRSRPLGRVRER